MSAYDESNMQLRPAQSLNATNYEEGAYESEASHPEPEDIKSILEQEIANSEYTASDTDDMNRAMAYYTNQPRGDEIEGRSSVQSADVADMVEAITAQVMPAIFTDDICQFTAISPEDEQAARLESRMVCHHTLYRNNGYVTIQQAVRDALLFRNCIGKVWVENRVTVKTEELTSPLTDIELLVLQQQEPNSEFIYNEEQLTLSKKFTTQKLIVETIPPEEFLYSNEWNFVDLAECPFTAHHREVSRHYLVQIGYPRDVVESLPSTRAIHPKADNLRGYDDYTNSSNIWDDPIDYYEGYVRTDFNRDGYAELRKVCMGGGVIIMNEEVDFHPFAGGTGIMMPHKFRGISVYDRLKQVQDAKTFTLRQWADNININNYPRLEVEMTSIVDPNDLIESRPGGIVKSRKIGSVAPISSYDGGDSSLAFLSYWDKIRTDRSGAALDMQGENMPIGENRTAHGAERLVSSREQVAALITKTISETYLRSLFLLVHKTMKAYMSGPISIKGSSDWFTTDPYHWNTRDEVEVRIGESQGEQNRKQQGLGSIIELYKAAGEADLKGIIFDDNNLYNALTDLTRCMGLDHVDKYWLDPTSEQSQQTAQMKSEIAKERQATEKALMDNETLKTQVEHNKNQSKMQIDALKLHLDKAKAAADAAEKDTNLQFDYIKHIDEMTMRLTEIETQYQMQVNDMEQNKKEVQKATGV